MASGRGKTGTLYVVATPIGNLSDISQRAVETLRTAACIAAEDTRTTGRLCAHYAIDTPMVAYHEHNETRETPRLIRRLERGEDVALVSDAGSPLVSDPGFRLVSAALDAALPVVPIPGPCAAVTALTAAGLPCHHFHFEGFLPSRPGARRNRLAALSRMPDTLVFYESAHRIEAALVDMAEVLGGERRATLARELTKLHETIRRDTLAALAEWVGGEPEQRKGEHVVLVEGATGGAADEGERVVDLLCEALPVSQAADLAARITGAPRNRLYRRALARSRGEEPG